MIFLLFKTFFKIGLFTIGGGYAMISVVKDECVDNKKWLENGEFLDLLAISESTPGPIAVNFATYIGYAKGKMLGAIVATLGVISPSIIVISIISLFIKDFLQIQVISYAFFGIRIAVSICIVRTAINLLLTEVKDSEIKMFSVILFLMFAFIMFFNELFNIGVSTILLVIVAVLSGTILAILRYKVCRL